MDQSKKTNNAKAKADVCFGFKNRHYLAMHSDAIIGFKTILATYFVITDTGVTVNCTEPGYLENTHCDDINVYLGRWMGCRGYQREYNHQFHECYYFFVRDHLLIHTYWVKVSM